MAGINHVAVKASGDKGYYTEWNADHKQKGNHDCEKFQHLNHVIENRTDWPAGPVEGQVVYRSDQHTFYHWNGTRWVSMVGPATVVVAADGSGETTDIQDGIDMLPATGGVVYIKEGTYNITVKITIGVNNTSIIGAGRSTIIQTANNVILIDSNGKDNLLIEKLYLNGSGNGQAQNQGIKLTGSDNSIVRNCWIEDCGNYALWVNNSDDALIEGNIIENNWTFGIYVDGTTTRSTISHNLCSGNQFQNMYFLNAGDYQIINGNQCNNSANSTGMYIQGCDYVVITGNECSGNSNHGIRLVRSNYCTISNNICIGTTPGAGDWSGIYVIDLCDNNTITGNVCSSNRNGIYIVNNTCDENLISGNQCTGNVIASIVDNGLLTLPNGAVGTTNLQLDDLNYV